jgi:uncharacterized protein (TIGR03083 family)
MDRNKRLFALRREGRAFAACLRDDTLDLAVPSCPGWAVRDLARHLTRVYSWAGAATRSSERPPRPEVDCPTDAAGLADCLLTQLALLSVALDGPPEQAAWSFAPGHGTLRFWQRRQLIESAVHRWDAQAALGDPAPIEDDVAEDGLDELADVLVGLRIAEGRLAPDVSVVFDSTAGGSWTLGEGAPVASVSGSASDLLLLGWGRLDADAPVLRWAGDVGAGQEIVRAGLTP